MESGANLDIPIGGITGRSFDQMVVLGEYGHGIGGPAVHATSRNQEWRKKAAVAEELGPVGIRSAGHPNIFPSCWLAVSNQISLRIPRSPSETEIWWFSFVDRNASPEERKAQIGQAVQLFGPAGLLEQDDGENWAQATMQTLGKAGREMPQMLNMGLGRGEVIKEHGLARIDSTTNEHAQLWTYYSWAQWMKGLSWEELRDGTDPPDSI